jgi:hypothetical protein
MKTPTNTRFVFIEFAARDLGLTREEAAFEFDNFLTINGMVRTKDSYLTILRSGAKLVTNRLMRSRIYSTFENAINHAEFQA